MKLVIPFVVVSADHAPERLLHQRGREAYDRCMMNASGLRGSATYIPAIEACAKHSFGERWKEIVETDNYQQWLKQVKSELIDK
ncbi:MAG: hypothetical protein FJ076_12590 [Cyanobacteria bacterium K_DeepCast_35m_m1_288]|nr:hypothetical protein [Cyanobacteria bacterium K_DeepCast_35m_m1_288]